MSVQAIIRDVGRAADESAEQTPLRFAFAIVLVLQAFVVLAFQPSYETNDDVFITMIASGKGICPAPDEHLIFTNVLVGKVLKQLYTAYASFPWYGCYLLAVHFAAQVAILYCTLVVGRTKVGRGFSQLPSGHVRARFGLYSLYYVLVELTLLNRFQFTTTAFVAAQAGIFLLLVVWRRRTRQTDAPVLGPLAVAVSFLFLGGIIRLESLAMALLIAAPLSLTFVRYFSFRALVPCGLAAATVGALVVGAVAYDHATYEHDPNWQGFRSFNQLRGIFHDGSWTFYTPETAQIFQQVGWTENDHAMIERWFSDDPELYSEAKLTTIASSYPWRNARLTTEFWLTALRDIARNRSVLSVLLVLPFALALVRGGPNARLAVVGSMVAAGALVVFITWSKKAPPERVLFPLVSFPLAASLLSFAWSRNDDAPGETREPLLGNLAWLWSFSAWQRKPLATRVVVILMMVSVGMGVYRQCRRSVHVVRDRRALQRYVDDFASAGRKLIVSWEAALPYQLLSPLDSLDAWSQVSILSLAWTQRTPWHEEIKREFGITNTARALYERKDMELVAKSTHRELFAQFAEEHFDANVEFIPRLEPGRRFVVGKFQQRPPTVRAAVQPDRDQQR